MARRVRPESKMEPCPVCGQRFLRGVGVGKHLSAAHRDVALWLRFWGKVSTAHPHSCWEWTGSRDPKGYGRLIVNGRIEVAHRVAWVFGAGKPVPNGMVVRHRCDNPPCCNPMHLAVGTRKDNWDDCVRRGRTVFKEGPDAPTAKLSADQVRNIRKEYAERSKTVDELAAEHGLRPRAIYRVIAKETYKNVS